ncbi:MAG: glycerol-3-phosphate dehydrogenase [Proteobacteria bacterium]|nr:MAG: glycerol-3-phosphate dehydrogenase [Pseudomonadota bacterium]
MQTDYDIIIIGGGASGSGIALDAASRGFKTLILEQNDFSSGTSSKSTKLLHGGVRYLEAAVKKLDKSQFDLVKEGLKERHRALKNAPHLSCPITLVTPIYRWWELPYMFIGLSLYDLIAGKRGLGRSKIISRKKVLQSYPHIKKEGLVGAVEYYDGSFNDTRFNISILKTAQKFACECKNYHRVEKFIYENGRVCGVEARDILEDKILTFKAKTIINATGAFSDEVRNLDDKNAKRKLELSSGIHIVLDKKYLPANKGLMIPKTKDGRVLFILPWMGKCLVGTTDEPSKIQVHPKVKQKDIEYILEHLEIYFDLKIDQSEILSSWSGIRPLVASDSENTASLVREHEIFSSPSGLISVIGGKWTTYRKMGEETLNFAIAQNNLEHKKCKTKDMILDGGEEAKIDLKIDENLKNYLLSMYGDKSEKVLKISDKIERLQENYPQTNAELIYCIRKEFVKKPLDFLVRRTSLALIDKKAALKILDKTISIMKDELKWNDEVALKMKSEAKEILEKDI